MGVVPKGDEVTFERRRQKHWQAGSGILLSLLMVETVALLLVSSSSIISTGRVVLLVVCAVTLGLLAYSLNQLFFFRAQVLQGAWIGMREAIEGLSQFDHLAGEAAVVKDGDITKLEQYLEHEGWRHVWTAVGIGSAGGLLLATSGVSMNVPAALWAGELSLFITAIGGTVLRVYNRIRHRLLIQQVERWQVIVRSTYAVV